VKRRNKFAIGILSIVTVCYVVGYLILSINGAYIIEVSGIGNGKDGNAKIVAKWYEWYPKSFWSGDASVVFGHHVRHSMIYFYLPLFVLDRSYWHTRDGMFTKKYSVIAFEGDEFAMSCDRDFSR
jgi:hypothetical protein